MKKIYLLYFLIIITANSIFAKDFWERVNVPNDNLIHDISILNNGNMIASGFGAYLTTNNGINWSDITLSYSDGQNYYISAIGHQINSVIAFNDTLSIGIASNSGFVKSVNSDTTWEIIDDSPVFINSLIKADNNRIFTNSYYNLYYSDDVGKSWKRYEEMELNQFNPPVYEMKMGLSPKGKLFVSNKGVWVIDPETLEGHRYTEGIDTLPVISFAFSNGKVYAGTDTNGIYISEDNGMTWKNLNNSPRGIYIKKLAVTQTGKILAGYINGGLYSSTDEGKTWQISTFFDTKQSVGDIEIKGNTIYVGSWGIFTSVDDGNSWQELNTKPGYPCILNMEQTNNSTIYLKTIYHLYRSSDNMISWKEFDGASTFDSSIVFCITDNGNFIKKRYEGRLKISEDEGLTYTDINFNDEINFVKNCIKRGKGYIYIHITDNKSRDKLYYSKNDGVSWNKINSPESFKLLGIGTNNEILIADSKSNLCISDNFGNTWDKKSNSLISQTGSNLLYCAEKSGENILIGSFELGVFISTDNGTSWENLNSQLNSNIRRYENIYFNDIKKTNGKFYISSDVGLFSYNPENKECILEDSGLINSNTLFTKYLKDKHLYVSSSTGLYRSTDEVVSVDENIEIDGINISVQPNPVINSGTINIECEDNSGLKLNLYDVSGNLVENIYDNTIPEGNTVLQFNPAKLSSGQYYLRAETDKSSKTKIISIVK